MNDKNTKMKRMGCLMSIFDVKPHIAKPTLVGTSILLYGERKIGKAQDLNSLVLTENGFIKMKEVKVGTKVYGEDGKLHNVTAVYDHEDKNMYKVTFTDGRSLICCDEHLWKVYTPKLRETNRKLGEDRHKVLTLEAMIKDYKKPHCGGSGNVYKYSVPLTKPIKFKEQKLPLHPYLLGVLLGDGGFTGGVPTFSNPEKDIVTKVHKLLQKDLNCAFSNYTGQSIQYNIISTKNKENELNTVLKKLNLKDKHSDTKFIPTQYLYNSIENRTELLRGLLDTDGHICKYGNGIRFHTVSNRMKEDVCWLVRSLGGLCTVAKDNRKDKFCWILTIRLDAKHYTTSIKHHSKISKDRHPAMILNIVDIKSVGKRPARCITVDNPTALYIAEDFIVTHNTSTAISFPKHFVCGFEKGWNMLNGVKGVPVKDWVDFKINFVQELVDQAEDFEDGRIPEKTFETIIIDTTDIAYEYCYRYICSKEGVTHLDYTENKRGYRMCKQEFMQEMFKLISAGYTLVFTSHAEMKTIDDTVTRQRRTLVMPTMDKNAFAIIAGVVDHIIYCQTMHIDGQPHRVACFRTDGTFEAGSRAGEFLPPFVPLGFKHIEKAIVDAMAKQAEKDSVDLSLADQSKEELKKASIEEEVSYEELMKEIVDIGNYLVSVNKVQIMNDISDAKLGVGNKVTNCSKLQVEVLKEFLYDLKKVLEEQQITLPSQEVKQ